MDEIHYLVDEIMRMFREPYSQDIIDDVFCAIQDNGNWLNRYNSLIKDRGKRAVNPQIGKLVKEYTGLSTISYPNKPKSNLIQSYSKLGNDRATNYPEAE